MQFLGRHGVSFSWLATDVIVARPLAIEHRRGVAFSVREFPDPELTKEWPPPRLLQLPAQHAKLGHGFVLSSVLVRGLVNALTDAPEAVADRDAVARKGVINRARRVAREERADGIDADRDPAPDVSFMSVSFR
jgi:hypothetical protein